MRYTVIVNVITGQVTTSSESEHLLGIRFKVEDAMNNEHSFSWNDLKLSYI